MRVPLADVVQLAAEAMPSAYREPVVKKGEPVKRRSCPSVLSLGRRGEGDLDVPAPPQPHKDPAGFMVIARHLPVLIDLPQHRRVEDDEPVVRRITKD